MAALLSFSNIVFLLLQFVVYFGDSRTQSIEKKFPSESKVYPIIKSNKPEGTSIYNNDNIHQILKDKSNEIKDLILLLQSDIKCHSRYVLKADQARLELVLTQKELRKRQSTNKACLIYEIRIARLKDIIDHYGLREKLMSNTIDIIYKRLQVLHDEVILLQKSIEGKKDLAMM